MILIYFLGGQRLENDNGTFKATLLQSRASLSSGRDAFVHKLSRCFHARHGATQVCQSVAGLFREENERVRVGSYDRGNGNVLLKIL